MAFKAGFEEFRTEREAHCHTPKKASRLTDSKATNQPQRPAEAIEPAERARPVAPDGVGVPEASSGSPSVAWCSCAVPLAASSPIVVESSCQISRTSATNL